MKLSKNFNYKNNIISIIEKFFDTEKIETIARAKNFVQRNSKLNSVIFFSLRVCLSERFCTKFGRLLQRSN
jgi:acyl carrier protein